MSHQWKSEDRGGILVGKSSMFTLFGADVDTIGVIGDNIHGWASKFVNMKDVPNTVSNRVALGMYLVVFGRMDIAAEYPPRDPSTVRHKFFLCALYRIIRRRDGSTLLKQLVKPGNPYRFNRSYDPRRPVPSAHRALVNYLEREYLRHEWVRREINDRVINT